MKKFSLCLPVLLLLCGCQSEEAAAPKMGMIATYPVGTRTLTYTIELGQEVKFRLAANPTTGFQWAREGEAREEEMALQLRFIAPRANGMTGVPGFTEVTAKPALAGVHRFKLLYRRSWEKNVPSAATVTVEIRVLPKNK